jgi:hypothetical protein
VTGGRSRRRAPPRCTAAPRGTPRRLPQNSRPAAGHVGDGAQSLNVAAPRGVFQRTRSARRPPRASVPARPSRPAQLSLEPRLAFVTAGLRCAAGQSSLPGTNDHASPRIPLRSLGRDERVRLVYLRWGRDVEPRRRSSIRLMSSSSVHSSFRARAITAGQASFRSERTSRRAFASIFRSQKVAASTSPS